jgi:hypothetical protein
VQNKKNICNQNSINEDTLKGDNMSESIDDKKIKQLETIMKLMKEHKINHVEIGDIKINRTHIDLEHPKPTQTKIETEDDILFYSSDY